MSTHAYLVVEAIADSLREQIGDKKYLVLVVPLAKTIMYLCYYGNEKLIVKVSMPLDAGLK